MKALIILGALFAVASAINPAAIYRSRCSEGASYWCQSATHADECGAVEYCIQNFWRGKLVQESATCSDCEAFVNAVHNVLEQTSVQSEIIDGAKQACVVMGSLSDLCQTLVETLGAEVLQKLVTELNGDEVCKVLQFCQEKSLQTNVNDDEICSLCKDAMNEADAFISNVTIQQDIENMLLQFCPLLSEIFPDCANFIQDEFPQVIQFLLTYINPESCSEIGLCPGTVELQNLLAQIKKLKNREGADLCSTCKSTVGTIDSLLSNSAIQQAVMLELDQLCYTLGPAAVLCKFAVNKYTPEIISMIVSYLNPETFCTEFRFCSSNGLDVNLDSDPCTDCKTFFGDVDGLLTNQTVQNMIDVALDDVCNQLGDFADQCKSYVDQYASLVFDFLASQLSPDQICADIQFCSATPERRPKKLALTNDPCADCKAFFTDVDGLLTNVTVQNMITADIEVVCSFLGSFADECKTYVTQYAPLVFSLVASQLNPDMICSDLQFCPAKMEVKLKKVALPADSCSDCQAFFGDIDNLLMNETVENMITADILALCDNLGSFADECKSYVTQYAPLVYSLVASQLNPDQICSLISFCPAETKLKFKQPNVGDAQVCTLCQSVISALETYVSSQANQAFVVDQLDTLICDNLPAIFSVQCRSVVKTYTPIVINLILSYMDPKTVCTKITLCPGTNAVKVNDPQFCSDCKAFLGDIDAMLSNSTFQAGVITQLEGLCAMAGSFEAECKLLIETYAPTLFAFIVAEMDPTTDCTLLNFCPGVSTPRIADPQLCSDCKNFIADIDALLSNQTFQNELIADVASLCSLAGSLQAECELLVKTYGPAAFAYLLSALDPTTACTTIGICPGNSAPVMLPMPVVSLPDVKLVTSLLAARPIAHKAALKSNDADCDLCKTIVGLFLPYIESNATEEEVLNAVSEACNILTNPETVQECKNYVHTYGSLIFELLQNELSPESVCQTLGQCTSVTSDKKAAAKVMKEFKGILSQLPGDDTLCTLCEIGIGELDTILSSNKTKGEIAQDIEKLLCDNLPSPINMQCVSFMQIYGEVIVQLLIDQLEPSTFCTDVGLCDAKKQVLQRKMPSLKASGECTICEFMVSELDHLITENSTEAEIREALDKVCSLLPSTVRSECDSLVSTYAEDIVKYLVLKYNPKALCTAIGICDAAEVDASANCILCEYIMSEVDKLLTENSTEAEIQEALDKVCSYLPATLRSECDEFVKEYGPFLLSYLTQELDPKKFCTTIGECQAKLKVRKPTASTECLICEFVMSELDTILKENATQEEIETALEDVCDLLPSTVRSDCDNFVETYTSLLVKLLVDESPDQICSLIAVCTQNTKTLLGSIECDLCQTTVREFMIAIQEPTVTKAIVALVNDTCAILPEDIKAECYTYVDQYGDLVTQFIAQFFDPITTCTLLEACPYPDNAPRGPKQLLGQHECTRGPGYWCASMENAKKCNMVEHCKRHAWN